jgi:signal transduction histidine kinase
MFRGGRIAITNVAFNRLCRAASGQLIWQPTPLDQRAPVPAPFPTLRQLAIAEARYFGEAGRIGPVRYRYRTSDRDRWIEALFDHLPEGNGRSVVVAMFTDVTAQARSEAALVTAEAALARQEQARAIGELAAGVAHDVSNTLGAIRLRLSALNRDPACMRAQGPNIEALDRIVSEGAVILQKLQRLGHDDDSHRAEPVDLAESIASAVEVAQSGLRYRALHDGIDIRITSDIPPLPPITAWRNDLQRVFVNLLINARDAMPVGGSIRVTGGRDGDVIVVVIEDDGTGIPPAILPRIFEPYFTTKGVGGTGMGLATAQHAMARLGGVITAANRPGGGAAFTLRFPLAAPAGASGHRRRRSIPFTEPT